MSFITTKLLGYLSGGLGALALASGAFAGLQTHRLHNARGSVKTLQSSLARADGAFGTVVTVANERAEALKGRDALIAQQSSSIDGLAIASETNRTRYLEGIRRADQGAQVHETRAAELSRPPAQAPSDRCEAARALIVQELLDVR